MEYRAFDDELLTPDWELTAPARIRRVIEVDEGLIVRVMRRVSGGDGWPDRMGHNVFALDADGNRRWVVSRPARPGDQQPGFTSVHLIGESLWGTDRRGGPRFRIDRETGEVRERLDDAVPAARGSLACDREVWSVATAGDRTVALLRGNDDDTVLVGVTADGEEAWHNGGTADGLPDPSGFSRFWRHPAAVLAVDDDGFVHRVDPEDGRLTPAWPQVVERSADGGGAPTTEREHGDQLVPARRASIRDRWLVQPDGTDVSDVGVVERVEHVAETVAVRSRTNGQSLYDFVDRDRRATLVWTSGEGEAVAEIPADGYTATTDAGRGDRLVCLGPDGTQRWERPRRTRGDPPSFTAVRRFGDRTVLRGDDDRWYDLDLATGDTAFAAGPRAVPLPEAARTFPYSVETAFSIEDLVVVVLDCPEDGVDAAALDAVEPAAEPPERAPPVGELSPERPILGISLDGSLRWHVEGYGGREFPTLQSVPGTSGWSYEDHVTFDPATGRSVKTGWRR